MDDYIMHRCPKCGRLYTMDKVLINRIPQSNNKTLVWVRCPICGATIREELEDD